MNKQALDLLNNLPVIPADNPASVALSKQNAEKQAGLAKLSAPACRKACAGNEAACRKTANGALETMLILSAGNPKLKSLFEAGLKIFRSHERRAGQAGADPK